MVTRPESGKACPKCARRRPLAEFGVGGVAGAPARARFCLACRTTLKHCPRCGEDKPVCEFTYVSQRRISGCKACYEALRERTYAGMRERIYAGMRERHRVRGVPAGASHYDQDPREVMLEPGRRRRARLRAAVREPIDRRVVSIAMAASAGYAIGRWCGKRRRSITSCRSPLAGPTHPTTSAWHTARATAGAAPRRLRSSHAAQQGWSAPHSWRSSLRSHTRRCLGVTGDERAVHNPCTPG